MGTSEVKNLPLDVREKAKSVVEFALRERASKCAVIKGRRTEVDECTVEGDGSRG